MAREVARDAVFGRLDCNDNTPVLQPQQNKTRAQPGLPSEWSGGSTSAGQPSALTSPLRCASRASNTSSMCDLNAANQALGTLITSNYNNDFFYDDEFSVQFDANLGDGDGTVNDVPMPEDVDISAILHHLPEAENDGGEAGDCIPASHSSSGQDPGDMSMSEGLDTSQEQSFSEQDCISSGELSELRSEPLFSPPPSQEEQNLSTDSLGRDASLSNSLLTEHDFAYDWTANKDQYMISFAGSIHKGSDTDSMNSSGTCAAVQGSLTSWAKHSKNTSPGQFLWGSDSSSVLSLGPRSGATSPVPPKSPDKPPRQPITAWTNEQEQTKGNSGLTTWRSLKETGNPKVETAGVRSKSLPELASKQHTSGSTEGAVEEDGQNSGSMESSSEEAVRPQKSQNLYELFQRLRSCSDEEDQGSLSPTTMNQLMGTWSMSPAGSDHSLTSVGTNASADVGSRLSSWATLQHLAGMHKEEGNFTKVASLETINEKKQFVDALVGSGVLTRSQIWGPPKKPPRITNSAVQTSIEGTLEMIEKAQQTSIAAFDRELAKRARHWLSILEIPPQVVLKYLARQQQEPEPVKPDKISNTVFYSNSRMPDLAFLQLGMTQSEALRTIMNKDYQTDTTQKVGRDCSPSSRRRSRSYDSSSCHSSGSSGIDPGSFNDSQSKRFMEMPSFPSAKARDILSESEYDSLVGVRNEHAPEGNYQHAHANTNIPLQKRVSAACRQCKKRNDIMSMSVPPYKGQVFARTPRDADYFDVFQPRDWYQMTVSAGIPGLMQRLQSPTPAAACHRTCIQHKPLKSCLVKKQQKQRSLFRNSSFSNHQDLTVMKYSQEGQTRYQLLAPAEGRECVHGLSGKTVPVRDDEVKAKPQPAPAAPLQVPPAATSSHKAGCPQAPQANSPDVIPVMPCPCQTPNSSQSSTSDVSPPALTQHHPRAKKSVSFSEEISYHSPKPSPHTSPVKQCRNSADEAPPVRPRSASLDSSKPVPVPGSPSWHNRAKTAEDVALDSSAEDAPNDFTVSPATSPPQSFIASTTAMESAPKRDLMLSVVRGTEIIVSYFMKTQDQNQKGVLGSTARSPEIGHLILKHLCPAVHAVLQDGLRPYTRSLFGQVRNCVWALVEESCQQGPATRTLHTLIQDLTNLAFLDTNWLRFNAFIFGLLNHKALDFWLTYLQHQDRLLLKHYEADSLMSMSTNRCRHMFMAMTTALQSLAQLPLRLEYTFEYRQQQQRHADFLLDKHVSAAAETQLEGQLLLKQIEHNRRIMCGEQMQLSAPGRLQPSLRSPVVVPEKPMALSEDSYLNKRDVMPPPGVAPPSYQEAIAQDSTWLASRQKKGGTQIVGRYQEQTALISLDAINSTLPVSKLLPKPSNKPLTPTPVPVLQGINDTSSSQTSITVDLVSAVPRKPDCDQEMLLQVTTTVSAAPVCQLPSPKSVAIVKNNEILVPDHYEDKPQHVESGLLSKVSQQLQPSLPDDKVYKRGITEYEFDLETDGKGQPNLTKASIKSIPCQGSQGSEVAPDWTQDSGIDEIRSQELAAKEMPVLRALPRHPRRDASKRWSEGEATALLCDSTSNNGKVEAGMSQVKKRWSTFGPKIIQFFDKLLLDENQKPNSDSLSPFQGEGCKDTVLSSQPEKENLKNEEQERSLHKEVPVVTTLKSVKASADSSSKKVQQEKEAPLSPSKSRLPVAKDLMTKKSALIGPQSSPKRGSTPKECSEGTIVSAQHLVSLPHTKPDSPASPCRESRIPTLSRKPVKSSRSAAGISPLGQKPSLNAGKCPVEGDRPPLGTSQECILPSGVVCQKEVVHAVSNYVTVYPEHQGDVSSSKPKLSHTKSRAQNSPHSSPMRRTDKASPVRKTAHMSPARLAHQGSPNKGPVAVRQAPSPMTNSQTSVSSERSVSSMKGGPRKPTGPDRRGRQVERETKMPTVSSVRKSKLPTKVK